MLEPQLGGAMKVGITSTSTWRCGRARKAQIGQAFWLVLCSVDAPCCLLFDYWKHLFPAPSTGKQVKTSSQHRPLLGLTKIISNRRQGLTLEARSQ